MTHTDPLEGTGEPTYEERMQWLSIRNEGPRDPIMIRFTDELRELPVLGHRDDGDGQVRRLHE